MLCQNCPLWRQGIPSGWWPKKPTVYGFCEALNYVMYTNESCIASKKEREKAILLPKD